MTEHPAAPTLPPHPQSNPRERILSRHLREKASIWDIPPSGGADDFRCVRDGESWPCDAVRLARSDLDEARAAARKEVLTPAEIRDLDMALRYSRIDHDYSCPAISPMALGDCTCGAAEYRERARLVTHRIGAPYRARSGDYLLDSLSTDTREEPR